LSAPGTEAVPEPEPAVSTLTVPGAVEAEEEKEEGEGEGDGEGEKDEADVAMGEDGEEKDEAEAEGDAEAEAEEEEEEEEEYSAEPVIERPSGPGWSGEIQMWVEPADETEEAEPEAAPVDNEAADIHEAIEAGIEAASSSSIHTLTGVHGESINVNAFNAVIKTDDFEEINERERARIERVERLEKEALERAAVSDMGTIMAEEIAKLRGGKKGAKRKTGRRRKRQVDTEDSDG
ncbi:hypothetical protein KIPB_006978, partial [Kipferlia bialata]